MNRKKCFTMLAVSTFVCLAGTMVNAVPFDPVFRVLRFKGECQVALPGSWAFTAVKPGKAYPFGSTLRTGSVASEATVALCDNNECKLLEGTTAQFTDENQDRENRTVHLLEGKVEVDLDQKNLKFTNRVYVKTAVGTAIGEKSRFTTAFSRQGEINEAIFDCDAGMIGLSGAQFQTTVMKEGSVVKVTGPNDLSWLRVQTVKGDIPYDLKNELGEPVTHPTKAGATVKINQRVTQANTVRHVVIWTLKPDGTTETNYNYKILLQAGDAGKEGAAGAQ